MRERAVQRGPFDQLAGGPLPHGRQNRADGGIVVRADDEPKSAKRSVGHRGWNLHAAVAIGPDDDEAERLVRYCARAPFALERLSVFAGDEID